MTESARLVEGSDGRRRIRLKYLISLLSRGTAPKYTELEKVRVVGQAANQISGLDWTRTRFHSTDVSPESLRGRLHSGDILINSTGTGTLGRVGYFTCGPDGLPCIADGHVTIVRANQDEVDSRYLYYWLSSPRFYDEMYSRMVVGATNQIELSREALSESEISIPDRLTQARIASFLDAELQKIDRVVSTRKRQLKMLDERYQRKIGGIFESYGSPLRVKYLLSSKPRYGVLVPEFVTDGVSLVRVNDLSVLDERIDHFPRIPEALSSRYPATVLRQGDVLVSVVGTLGRSAVVPLELVGANVNRAIAVLRPSMNVDRTLLSEWLASDAFQRQAMIATGSDSAQRTLGMEDLANFEVSWPGSMVAQSQAAAERDRALEEFRNLQDVFSRQIELLLELREVLIVGAVTGQIDVTTARGADV